MDITPHAHVIIPNEVLTKIMEAINLGRVAVCQFNPDAVDDLDFVERRIKETAVSLVNPIKLDTKKVF